MALDILDLHTCLFTLDFLSKRKNLQAYVLDDIFDGKDDDKRVEVLVARGLHCLRTLVRATNEQHALAAFKVFLVEMEVLREIVPRREASQQAKSSFLDLVRCLDVDTERVSLYSHRRTMWSIALDSFAGWTWRWAPGVKDIERKYAWWADLDTSEQTDSVSTAQSARTVLVNSAGSPTVAATILMPRDGPATPRRASSTTLPSFSTLLSDLRLASTSTWSMASTSSPASRNVTSSTSQNAGPSSISRSATSSPTGYRSGAPSPEPRHTTPVPLVLAAQPVSSYTGHQHCLETVKQPAVLPPRMRKPGQTQEMPMTLPIPQVGGGHDMCAGLVQELRARTFGTDNLAAMRSLTSVPHDTIENLRRRKAAVAMAASNRESIGRPRGAKHQESTPLPPPFTRVPLPQPLPQATAYNLLYYPSLQASSLNADLIRQAIEDSDPRYAAVRRRMQEAKAAPMGSLGDV
ncbi:unnamed protein product [Peniophora sp. CBMAI 1063]|nr:unnamed protein product [Peniophora sp. CBMAI 1063]